ncbi:CHRD domain containing protein [Methylobacterium sp. 4-46]|uniref:CHRD domain-containing protein n=1 Tax=unclassified Methylobacterium TaxID=2615210 RepID=UPI000152D513|nr:MULTISPECIES: CHRD domain-containing protein [Methylobacterium]ACA20986.1 CHRD domain containing protein [Methylobacterium sp. 4-46]WFT80140.1 CHRD domain-containing protein [Methylobacterium nodulans]
MIPTIRRSVAALVLSLPFGLAGSADAAGEKQTFRATLNGTSEVPPNQTKGSGEVTATYDPETKTLNWRGSYSGLTGSVTAAHFHGPAAPGQNAGVLIPAPAATSPFEGSAALDEAKAADLLAGKLYFNIHTAENPKGEIRGQVERAP